MNPHKAHYKDGNGVENEKLDAYWHIGHDSKSSEEFDNRARQPWVKAWHDNDGVPEKNQFRKDA